jgi:hypothetical protein
MMRIVVVRCTGRKPTAGIVTGCQTELLPEDSQLIGLVFVVFGEASLGLQREKFERICRNLFLDVSSTKLPKMTPLLRKQPINDFQTSSCERKTELPNFVVVWTIHRVPRPCPSPSSPETSKFSPACLFSFLHGRLGTVYHIGIFSIIFASP